MSIGVLITSYKRPHTLRPQLEAIDGQTVKADDLVILHDDGGAAPDLAAMRGRKVVSANFPTGVWPRFAFCLFGFDTKYVAVFDDDTIPGPRWFENCLSHQGCEPRLLGPYGVRFPKGTRQPREFVGFASSNERLEAVDMVGHAWFFERNMLRHFCAAQRPTACNKSCGEDYHISEAHWSNGGIVAVPPHPASDVSLWGSLYPELGTDDVALYRQPGAEQQKVLFHGCYRLRPDKSLIFP